MGAVLVTVVGDVVKLPCLLLASYLVGRGSITLPLAVVSMAASLFVLLRAWRSAQNLIRRLSGMDLLGTICLVVALALWGVA